MDYFKEICCFILIAETFVKLCPNKKYEDYIRMITGFICIAIVLTPVLVWAKGEQKDMEISLSEFEIQLQEQLKESEKQWSKELEGKMEEGWNVDEEAGISAW